MCHWHIFEENTVVNHTRGSGLVRFPSKCCRISHPFLRFGWQGVFRPLRRATCGLCPQAPFGNPLFVCSTIIDKFQFTYTKPPRFLGAVRINMLNLCGIVRCFLCDVNIVWVRFLKTCACNLYKLCLFVEFRDCCTAAVTHT